MVSISQKVKNLLVFTIKIVIVLASFYFIYNRLTQDTTLNWSVFKGLMYSKFSFVSAVFIIAFSFVNRFLEILKWKNLVSFIKPITVGEATKQVLGALTAGIFTPNGLGEYAGKALFFEKVKTKKIVFLNLICNGIQMILTVMFGTLGLLLLGYWKWFLGVLIITSLFLVLGFVFKEVKIKGYSVKKVLDKIEEIPKLIHQKNIVLGICRYLVFSHQYYFLFLIFDIHLPYLSVMSSIMVVYFLSSSLPSFQFLDFAVKGSVSVYFFSKLGINQWVVMFITTFMWLFNVVIPVIIGSYFVLKFKPKWMS